DIDDLFDDDYTLRLTDYTGRRYDLSMFGKAYGQIAADVAGRRRDRLQHDLLLTGIGKPEPFPGSVFGPTGPAKAELRLFDDLLVAMPERGLMWGLPYSFIDRVEGDAEQYRVRVVDDGGVVHEFGWLAKRSEQFRDMLQRRLDELAARTARTLGALLPGVDPSVLGRLAAVMRDGRAVQQRTVEAIDPALWTRLEAVVVGTEELRASYEVLGSMSPPGWAAFGVKAVDPRTDGPGPADPNAAAVAAANAGEALPADDPPGPPTARLWYFCPLARDGRPLNAVAQEITSEGGHATYVFRLMEPERFAGLAADAVEAEVAAAVARLNRTLLSLNFRREPIYTSDEQIQEGPFGRYRVALRKLDYLQWARKA
ncbi:MAG TPA: hypothetical protein DIT48_08625, partial [Actinobacteria bacterium]|nr:hypothetical protein [Actinomycetota bacterium]